MPTLESVREVTDQELEDAIEELKRSTAAIEKQNDAIKQSKAALASLKDSRSKSNQARSQVDASQTRKWTIERDQIQNAVCHSDIPLLILNHPC